MKSILNKIYDSSPIIEIDDKTKIVIMSDVHRGSGNNHDNFIKNKNIFNGALYYYNRKKFTYIELGDGDDMWEVSNYKEIIREHLTTFKIIKKFYLDNRFIMIYGNHDMCKKNKKILKKYFYHYNDEELLKDLEVYESLLLEYKGDKIFLIHGHQVELLNSKLWILSRFLVRHVWVYLEIIGFKDPTKAAKNHYKKNKTEKKYKKWSNTHKNIIITGHTHRATYPIHKNSLYFNDGSCINPNGITAIELEKGQISLVKWDINVKENASLYVKREVLEGPKPISSFFL